MKYPAYRGDEPCTAIGPELYDEGFLDHDEIMVLRGACVSCWIVDDCREWALHHEPTAAGFWGGLTDAERRQVRRARRISVVDPVTIVSPWGVRRASA